MDHFYRAVPGAFTFPDFYSYLALEMAVISKREKRTVRVAEVGVYRGQSVAYLGVELINRGLGGNHDGTAEIVMVDRFDEFSASSVVRALEPIASVLGRAIVGDSAKSADVFADASFDAVFIDAGHDYENVAADIDAWRPKVRSGGILAGHDFSLRFPGVIRAVKERFDRVSIWRGVLNEAEGDYFPVWEVAAP
jgi:predicted O-methyltransferase YrrM